MAMLLSVVAAMLNRFATTDLVADAGTDREASFLEQFSHGPDDVAADMFQPDVERVWWSAFRRIAMCRHVVPSQAEQRFR